MAKLVLKYENTTLKEMPLTQGVVTIGRLPDNMLQVDNLAVSGHHAKVLWENGHFVLEDNNSFNGTFINNQRITRQTLNDNDIILIGKHTLTFKAEPLQAVAPAANVPAKPALAALEGTAMLDTKKARELMAQALAAKAGAIPPSHEAPITDAPLPPPPPPAKRRLGLLTVISGKTDQNRYVLTGKLTVVGKSEMASIRLKGWFAPKVAAAINHHDDKYFIAPSGRQRIKVNGEAISGQRELQDGDTISVYKVEMSFGYAE